MSVRAKFYLEKIEQTGYSDGDGKPKVNTGKRYTFKAVYSNDPNHENKLFFTATPQAELVMYIDNPAAQVFEIGHQYYLDFTPAE